MTREQARKVHISGQGGYDFIDKIYDDFESRTCESCKYFTSVMNNQEPMECSNEFLNKMDENLDVSDNYFRPDKNFGCNKYKQKIKQMEQFKKYIRTNIAEMRPITTEETKDGLSGSSISISLADRENGSPKLGDMIARNPLNHNDEWLVASDYFKENFEEIE